jgi:ATP-dependent protease ClpP protease subunit
MNLEITGEIFDSVNTDNLISELQNAQEDVTLTINSPGGDVFAGLNIVNAIRKCAYKVHGQVEVLAASMAAIIALACDDVTIDEYSVMMLHNCWTVTGGNKEQIQKDLDAMTAIDAIIHDIISAHAVDKDLAASLDGGDMWLTAAQAADAFDHVTVASVERQEDILAAKGGLTELVLRAQKVLEDQKKDEDKPAPAEEDPDNGNEDDNPDSGDDSSDDGGDEGADGDDQSGNDQDPDEDAPDKQKDDPPKDYEIPSALKDLLDRADKMG